MMAWCLFDSKPLSELILIRSLETNFSVISIKSMIISIQDIFENAISKMWPFCLSLNVLKKLIWDPFIHLLWKIPLVCHTVYGGVLDFADKEKLLSKHVWFTNSMYSNFLCNNHTSLYTWKPRSISYDLMQPRAPFQYKDRLIYVWRFPC